MPRKTLRVGTKVNESALLYGLDLLLEGVYIQYTYLPDYNERVTTLTDGSSWFKAFDHIQNGTIDTLCEDMYITPQQYELLQFTYPVYSVTFGALYRIG